MGIEGILGLIIGQVNFSSLLGGFINENLLNLILNLGAIVLSSKLVTMWLSTSSNEGVMKYLKPVLNAMSLNLGKDRNKDDTSI